MILYLDTSAVVKLYVEELASARVREAVEEAQTVATSLIAYVEALAAFAQARREVRLSPPAYRRVVRDFDRDWESYLALEVTESLVRRAAMLADRRSLRGYGAMHLASALILGERADAAVAFFAFDERLSTSARREGLILPDQSRR